MEKKHTKYEIARMIGSRALQISMGAPFLVKLSEKDLEAIGYNPIEIAKLEFEKDLIPIAIRRPVPKKAKVESRESGDSRELENAKRYSSEKTAG